MTKATKFGSDSNILHPYFPSKRLVFTNPSCTNLTFWARMPKMKNVKSKVSIASIILLILSSMPFIFEINSLKKC